MKKLVWESTKLRPGQVPQCPDRQLAGSIPAGALRTQQPRLDVFGGQVAFQVDVVSEEDHGWTVNTSVVTHKIT